MPTEIARTGERFADFAPYVASLDDRGQVCFQAALAGGGDGVFVWRDGDVEPVDRPEGVRSVVSHPDIDEAGQICAYVELEGGDTALAIGDRVIDRGEVGPLGPVIDGGAVAYRARGGLHLASPGADPVAVAVAAGDRFSSFEGLPCATGDGAVLFRADRAGDCHGVYRWRRGSTEALAETGRELSSLGRFPAPGPDGGAVFAAIDRDGRHGAWIAAGGSLRPLEAAAGFESVRGALWCPRGFVFYATERGGQIAIYTDSRRVIGIGDEFHGAAITAFVLNPVSINRGGQLALRLELSSGDQAIARIDAF